MAASHQGHRSHEGRVVSHLTGQQLERIATRTRAERAAQGLPATVQDPATLAKVARLVAGAARAVPSSGTRPARLVSGQGTSAEVAS